MRVVGQGIEKEIGQPLAGEMLRGRQPRREHETVWIDAPRVGFVTKIVLDEIVCVQQPKHGSWDRGQETHPNAEKLRRDLVGVVERAKDEALLRETASGARQRGIRDQPMGVGRLMAMWKMDNFFAVEGLLIHRQHEWIGDHIVNEAGAHRSRKAGETHLYGSRSLRGNPGARAFRVTRQFDKYIDPIGPY